MADQDKKDKIKIPERQAAEVKKPEHFNWNSEKQAEKKEVSQDEKIVSEELKREIELMNLNENLREEAQIKAGKIQYLADDQKLENLLQMAREKGVAFAIQVAKKMNDPYLLDTLHDILAKEGYYQKFIK